MSRLCCSVVSIVSCVSVVSVVFVLSCVSCVSCSVAPLVSLSRLLSHVVSCYLLMLFHLDVPWKIINILVRYSIVYVICCDIRYKQYQQVKNLNHRYM